MSVSRGFHGSDVARCWAGFASFGAGLVHVAVVREHLDVSVLQGAFFALVGVAQIGWALWALSGPGVPRPRLTAVATAAVIALWVVSRTVGLPTGLGGREAVGTADVLAVVLEIGLILCIALAAVSSATVRRDISPQSATPALASARVVALLAAGALAVSAIATPAMAATSAGDHAHPHGHSPSQEQAPADQHTPGSELDHDH